MSDPLSPQPGLAVEFFDPSPTASGKEGIADIANAPLDSALLVTAPDLTRPSLKMVMTAQLQQPRMEPHLIAKAFQNGRT
jgi:hypothetical protein